MRPWLIALLAFVLPAGPLLAAPAKKPAPPRAPTAASVLAKLKAEEASVRTARITLLNLHRLAELPESTKGAAEARAAVLKAPLRFQQREYLVFTGPDWKRDITMMDPQGNVGAHYLMGSRDKTGRLLQESGHGESATREALIGATPDQNAADRLLFHRGSDVLQGVSWKSVTPSPGHLTLKGSRSDEQITLVLRTTPGYLISKLSVTEPIVTPQGAATRGQELTAQYEPGKKSLKSVEHLIYMTGAVSRAALMQYRVEGLQVNQPVKPEELVVAFPAGTRVTDRRVEPPVSYAQGEKDLTLAEVRDLARSRAGSVAKVGTPAPDWELKDLSGKPVKLSAHRGKIVLLTWFASWCPPCHAEAPVMEKEIWQKYRARGLVVIGVNASEREEPEKMAAGFVSRHSLTYPVVLDTADEASNAYQVKALPTLAVIDRKGVLRYLQAGFDHPGVVAELERLLSEP